MTWKAFTTFQSSPTSSSFPNLPDYIIWLRIVLGVAYGISLGYREGASTSDEVFQPQHINGAIGILFGLNIITFVPTIYMNFYLNAETDTYKNLNFAGVTNGIAIMVLVWLTFFTMLHEKEESVLAEAFTTVIKETATGVIGEDISDGVDTVIEESEF